MQSLIIGGKGATPIVVPWPDGALALSQGQGDGLVSTHSTVVSGKLRDSVVKYAFEDSSLRMYQMLLISQKAWDGLPGDLQVLMENTWEDMLPGFLEAVCTNDDEMRTILEENGITVSKPSAEDIAALYQSFAAEAEAEAGRTLKIDPLISDAIQKARATN